MINLFSPLIQGLELIFFEFGSFAVLLIEKKDEEGQSQVLSAALEVSFPIFSFQKTSIMGSSRTLQDFKLFLHYMWRLFFVSTDCRRGKCWNWFEIPGSGGHWITGKPALRDRFLDSGYLKVISFRVQACLAKLIYICIYILCELFKLSRRCSKVICSPIMKSIFFHSNACISTSLVLIFAYSVSKHRCLKVLWEE